MTQEQIPKEIQKWIDSQMSDRILNDYDSAVERGFEKGAEAMYRHLKSHTVEGEGLKWVKASERRPDHCKLVIIRPIYNKHLAIVGEDRGDASEWATDSNHTWWFDDTEWLDESAPSSSIGDGWEEKERKANPDCQLCHGSGIIVKDEFQKSAPECHLCFPLLPEDKKSKFKKQESGVLENHDLMLAAADKHCDKLDKEYQEHAFEDFCEGWKARHLCSLKGKEGDSGVLRWVNVNDRLPEERFEVYFVRYGKNSRGTLHTKYFKQWNVTHWLDESSPSIEQDKGMKEEEIDNIAGWFNYDQVNETETYTKNPNFGKPKKIFDKDQEIAQLKEEIKKLKNYE